MVILADEFIQRIFSIYGKNWTILIKIVIVLVLALCLYESSAEKIESASCRQICGIALIWSKGSHILVMSTSCFLQTTLNSTVNSKYNEIV